MINLKQSLLAIALFSTILSIGFGQEIDYAGYYKSRIKDQDEKVRTSPGDEVQLEARADLYAEAYARLALKLGAYKSFYTEYAEKAYKDFTRLIRTYPEEGRYLIKRGNLILTIVKRLDRDFWSPPEPLQNIGKARQDFIDGLKLNPAKLYRYDALSGLHEIALMKKDTTAAIKLLGEVIALETSGLKDDLTRRAHLLTQIGEFQRALKDHDRIVSISDHEYDKIHCYESRAQFKLDYLHDYNSAATDMIELIRSIPEDHMRDRPYGRSEYAGSYFILGQAYYNASNYPSAFRSWLIAERFGNTQQGNTKETAAHYDSLALKHHGVGKLHLAKAFSHWHRAQSYPYPKETRNTELRKSIDEAVKGIQAGENGWLSYYCLAESYQYLEENKAALNAINKAIKLAPDQPELYLKRYGIRRDLGKAEWGNKEDHDLVRYRKLVPEWNFLEEAR